MHYKLFVVIFIILLCLEEMYTKYEIYSYAVRLWPRINAISKPSIDPNYSNAHVAQFANAVVIKKA